MEDIRQSKQFAHFMEDIGWEIEKIDHYYIYLRKFPLLGFFAKIPRFLWPLNLTKLLSFKKEKRIFRLKLAPFLQIDSPLYQKCKKDLVDHGFKIDLFPFNPTTTIQMDLTKSEETLFHDFTEAKRRGVRRAIKNGIFVRESVNLEEFIQVRKKQYFPIGFLVGIEMRKLWQNFYPKKASLLLAYFDKEKAKTAIFSSLEKKRALAGILLLYHNKTAYYWHASALSIGKKLFAPTLLVWEAFKLAKKQGYQIFDFEGVYDQRFPKAAESWKGFTKFKEGFSGKEIIYSENFSK